jgi:hypothetical protein
MLAAMSTHTLEPWQPQVIVCLGEAREVRHGSVECPQPPSTWMPVEACIDCRLLAWYENERLRGPQRSTEPVGPASPEGSEAETCS